MESYFRPEDLIVNQVSRSNALSTKAFPLTVRVLSGPLTRKEVMKKGNNIQTKFSREDRELVARIARLLKKGQT